MKVNPNTLILFLCMSGLFCSKKQDLNQEDSNIVFEDILTIDGVDTLITGIPQALTGQKMDLANLIPPSGAPVKRTPGVTKVKTNQFSAGQAIVSELKAVPRSFPAVGDGNPSFEEFEVPIRKVPVGKLPTVKALPSQVKENARTSIFNFDLAQGLSSSVLVNLLQDERGAIWMATYGQGFIRYDGNHFQYLTTKEGLLSNLGICMAEDSKGNLWFGGVGGLTLYDGQKLTHLITLEDFGTIFTIHEGPEGKMWVVTYNGVFSFQPSTNYDEKILFTRHLSSKSPNLWFWTAVEDSHQNLWFSTRGDGLYKFDGTHFHHYTTQEGLNSNAIGGMWVDTNGDLWLASFGGGVIRFDGHSFYQYTTEQGLHSNLIRTVFQDRQGKFWFGGEAGGLSIFDGRVFIQFSTENINQGNVSGILEDDHGNIWLALYTGGLTMFPSNRFENFSTEDGLPNNYIGLFNEDADGRIGMVSIAEELSVFDGHSMTLYQGEGVGAADQFWLDKDGQLYFKKAGGGLVPFKKDKVKANLSIFGLEQNWNFVEDNHGHLWFSRNNLYCFDGKNITRFTISDGLRAKIVDIAKDERGYFWLTYGGNSRGISRIQPNKNGNGGNITHFSTREGLLDNMTWFALTDSRGYVWVSSLGGLNRIEYLKKEDDSPSFTSYTTEEGLSHNYTLDLLEDSLGRIWASSLNGISILSPTSEDRQYDIYTLSREDGLLGISVAALYKDEKNQLWMGSSQNVSRLNLNNFQVPASKPVVQLNSIEVNQRPIGFHRLKAGIIRKDHPFEKRIERGVDSVAPFFNYPIDPVFPHQLNHLTFQFSALDWASPQKLKYSYYMEGMDDDWSVFSNESKAEYRNLSPGFYTFKIKVIGAALKESAVFEYAFRILPPWWQTTWAYVIYLLLIFLLGYLLYKYLLNRRLEKEEAKRILELDQVKTRLYTDISHEFRTPLTVISGMTRKIDENPQKWVNEGTSLIHRNAQYLLKLVDQILDLRKLEAGGLQVKPIQQDIIPYLKYLLESFHSLAENKNIQLHFLPDAPQILMDFDPEKIQHIFTNLLSNAIKYTPEGGDVYVRVGGFGLGIQGSGLGVRGQAGGKHEGSYFLLEIRDTGIGIPEDQLPHIFNRFYQVDHTSARNRKGTGIGLALTKELVQLLKGDISVKSGVRAGTTFTIHLPISNETPLQEVALDQISKVVAETALAATGGDGLMKNSRVADSKPQALIVEDNPDVAKYIFSCLDENYQLLWAQNGRQGIDKAFETVPDIIISDVMMPEKDGFEVCKTLKQDMRTSHIPIILLTAKADAASKLEGLSYGADAYLAKPFQPEELGIRLQKLIELRRQL